MQHQFRTDLGRNSIICVDSYEEGVLQGRLYSPFREMEQFSSLSQLLLKVEHLLDQQMSKPCTKVRAFSEVPAQFPWNAVPSHGGARATFELQVLFRQHASWQGVLRRTEENVQYQFRSVLELVALLDSALSS